MIPAVSYYGYFRHSLIAFTLISHYSSNTYNTTYNTRRGFLLVRGGVCVPVSRRCVSSSLGDLFREVRGNHLPTSTEVRRSDPRASDKSPAAFLLSDLGVDRYVPICIPHQCAPVLDGHLPPGIRARTPHVPPETSQNLRKPEFCTQTRGQHGRT